MGNVYMERINALRAEMASHGVAAVIIPQADAHLSEYLAPHWQLRRWLSGFTGSAGDLVVTSDKALLWTDSRYFLQAAAQLEGSGVELMKDGLAETPSIVAWLCANVAGGAVVGVDGMLFPAPRIAELKSALNAKGIELDVHSTLADGLWPDRPALPENKIYIHDIRFAGESARSKIAKIIAAAKQAGADATFISALDDIAWTLNVRCDDVRHTPVATGFLYLSPGHNIFFIDPVKLNDETRAYLASEGVETLPYTEAQKFLSALRGVKVLVEPNRTSGAVIDILGDAAVAAQFSPATMLKACKNDVQLAGVREAMVRDGVAMVRSLMEIERRMACGEHTTELDIAEILRNYRSQDEHYRDESFGTIAGYGPHGAIVHYEADEDSNSTLQPAGLLLIDSGAQYLDGTTDITRTIALGTPTAQEKNDFTLVMKGHIALATMMFPDDTRGAQLDAIARQYLWRNGLSYLHGTGHGVGHFLGVHEGPQSIRLNWVDTPMRPGMITSNEPGLYRAGVHGIRCENLVLCHTALENEFGRFLCFETLTLCPFDRRLFAVEMMSDDEIEWVNGYHATVRERLTPYLTDAEAAWLKEKTEKL